MLPSKAYMNQFAITSNKPKSRILSTSAGDVAPGAKWDARFAGDVPHTTSFYLKCAVGGVLSCGLTHLAVTPLDVAKCNMQVKTEFELIID